MGTDLSALRLSIRYDEGEGPAIVLLHGINSDGTDWRPVIDRIGSDYRCIAVDLLGFGESEKPADIAYTADDHSLVLYNTLNDLNISGSFVLVGYSLGGDIAVRYAAQHPKQIRRLFLLSSPFYLPPQHFSRTGFAGDFINEIFMKRLWKWISRAKKTDNVVYELASGRFEGVAKGFFRTDDVPAHWDIMSKNLTNCIGRATLVDDLPKLTMPVVFALGVRDPIVRPDQTPALKRMKPDMEIRRIVGLTADHFMLLNLPERVADEIMADEVSGLHVGFRAGSGEPLILLHGLTGDSGMWREAAEALSRGYDVATIDLLGFGSSPAPLSYRYDLQDQAAAVWATTRALFGERQVTFAGQGLGASIALACAGSRPGQTAGVVSFSPLLLPPGADATGANVVGPSAASEVVSAREMVRRFATHERTSEVVVDAYEERVVPFVRSVDNAVFGVDAARLLDAVKAPHLLVLGDADDSLSATHARQLCEQRPACQILEVCGGADAAIQRPATAVRAIAPHLAQHAPEHATATRRNRSPLTDYLNSALFSLVRRGVLALLGGIVLFLIPGVPTALLELAFAGWVLVEGFSTIAGAVGLRRSGKNAWLGWLLVGALTVGVSLFMLNDPATNLRLLGIVISIRALVVGASSLYVARKVGRLPVQRWALYAEGVLGVAIGVLIWLKPEVGGNLLRYTLAGYLTVSGTLLLAATWSIRASVRSRVRRETSAWSLAPGEKAA